MPEQHPTQPQQPQQTQQPQPPAPQPPHDTAPARRNWFARHKILTGVGAAVIALIAIAAINGGGSGDAGAGSAAPASQPSAESADAAGATEAPAEEPATEEAAAELPGIGDTVTSGKLEVTVVSLEEVGTTVGGQYLQETAQGRYVRIEAKVANSGTDPKLFTISSFTIRDAEGRSFNADTMATITEDPEANTWATEINPGNSVQGGVLFDLPEGAVPTTLEVSGGVFSGAETISLLG
ncbi:DUF4352 domain-containing protein [Leucobacter sp. M11]|uniref:DUF4352 domain-containing protein n=1 Tax=Leucobacter sp. M11 TaxID=2993565 RepID=UPI002D7FBC24|nr:DUF4352 domain-containing protein [Leucobacter sp. M11]MEB4616522.1 DUF4352 domain-containing protein [Leucobacter sp. M11]